MTQSGLSVSCAPAIYNVVSETANQNVIATPFLGLPDQNAVPDLQQQFSTEPIFPTINQANQYNVYAPMFNATFNNSHANADQVFMK